MGCSRVGVEAGSLISLPCVHKCPVPPTRARFLPANCKQPRTYKSSNLQGIHQPIVLSPPVLNMKTCTDR